MIPNNFNTGKYADPSQRIKRAKVAGRKGAKASPWSRGPMVPTAKNQRAYDAYVTPRAPQED
jgi:hypothetical protein